MLQQATLDDKGDHVNLETVSPQSTPRKKNGSRAVAGKA